MVALPTRFDLKDRHETHREMPAELPKRDKKHEWVHAHKYFQQSTQGIPNFIYWAPLISIQYSIFLPGWSHVCYLVWRIFLYVRFLLEKLIPPRPWVSLQHSWETKAWTVIVILSLSDIYMISITLDFHSFLGYFCWGGDRFPSVCMMTDLCCNTLQG